MNRSLMSLVSATALVVLAGCGSAAPTTAPPTSSPAPAPTSSQPGGAKTSGWDDPAAATAGGKVGPGTACAKSLAFDIPAKWGSEGDFSAMGGVKVAGTMDLVCEIDAKPAGILGLMRVFAEPTGTGDLKARGEAFVADWSKDATAISSREFTVGGARGFEFQYRTNDHNARAFVVRAGKVTYVVHWAGADDDEHTAGLPAYVLARTSAKVS